MKKIYLFVVSFFAVAAASAQLSAGAHFNYTMYKGSLQKATPGIGVRVGYNFSPKVTTALGFTMGMPMTQPSTVTLQGTNGDSKTVQSEFQYHFKTIHLLGQYAFVGDEENQGKFYGLIALGYVMAGYKEKIKEAYDNNTYQPVDQFEKGSENGFTMNFGLGGEYSLATEGVGPRIFGEAALALPANQQNGEYVENNIPAHFMFNAGLRFSFGSSNN